MAANELVGQNFLRVGSFHVGAGGTVELLGDALAAFGVDGLGFLFIS